MIKTVMLFRRKPGMSSDEFIDYYENHHRQLGEKYLRGAATRYFRRYLSPIGNPLSGEQVVPPFDVITEVWFSDRDGLMRTLERLKEPAVSAEIFSDTLNLFAPARSGLLLVEEHESNLEQASPAPAGPGMR